MKTTFLLLIASLFGFALFSGLDQENSVDDVLDKLHSYHNQFPQEKVYLHFDKTFTSPGETIWFKVYLVDATNHLPSLISQLVYVELVDPKNEIVQSKMILIREGSGNGDFMIDDLYEPGQYQIRAYTEYMKGFDESFLFRREIYVGDQKSTQIKEIKTHSESFLHSSSNGTSNELKLHLFPEGGNLVNGIPQNVAFVIDNFNQSAGNINGGIYDETGTKLVSLISNKYGYGKFAIVPDSSRKLKAVLKQGETMVEVLIPDVSLTGYSLSVIPKSNKEVIIQVRTNIPGGLKEAFLVGHIRGEPVRSMKFNEDQDQFTSTIDISDLSSGICHFTLFANSNEPVCERLIYIENRQDRPVTEVNLNKETYQKREKVDVQVRLSDDKGNPIIADLSASVVDITNTGLINQSYGILSYLLVNSDLNNPKPFISEIIESDKASRLIDMDLVMMTHGWRRFQWEKVLVDTKTESLPLLQQGVVINGLTTRYNQPSKPVISLVSLSSLGQDGFKFDNIVTDDSGQFTFHGHPFEDSTTIVLQAFRLKNKKAIKKARTDIENGIINIEPKGNRKVSLKIIETNPPEIHRGDLIEEMSSEPEEYLKYQNRINVIDSIYTDIWTIDLPEIEIEQRRKVENQDLLNNDYFGRPDYRLTLDSLPYVVGSMTVFDLIRQVPGVRVFGSRPNQIAVIRGVSSFTNDVGATFFLDGMQIGEELVNTLSTYDIESIDVFTGPNFFGVRGGNGVIALRSRKGSRYKSENDPDRGIVRIKFPGYYKSRQFYSPDYSISSPEHVKPDFRITLFWEPNLKTNSEGFGSMSFFTCDELAEYLMTIEGITSDGQLIHHYKIISVE